MILIGILSRLKSTFSGGGSDIDSKIDSAFLNAGSKASSGAQRNEMISKSPSASVFQKPAQPSANAGSSVSERVLSGHQKFGEQFRENPSFQASGSPYASASQFNRFSGNDDYGRFGDEDPDIAAAPLDFGRDAESEPPDMPPPLQVRRDALEMRKNEEQESSGLESLRKPLEFPSAGTNSPARTQGYAQGARIAPSSPVEQRLLDEIEDIKAQNNEILRRIQRLEAKVRS